ncbi:MAG: hypothetical protein COA95_04775 [Methylophaga sp.]|nr:MAG: hypothetical protein COA95_04775 [Methylophaga sp.]
MDDLVMVGFMLSGLSIVATWFFARFYFTRKKKWNEKIEELEKHLEYVNKVRKSSIEMSRQAFRSLFVILFSISFALFIPSIVEYATLSSGLEWKHASVAVALLKVAFLSAAVVISFKMSLDFRDVIHYQKAVERINRKLEKLKNKVANV